MLTYRQTDSPCVPQDFVLFGSAAQKAALALLSSTELAANAVLVSYHDKDVFDSDLI